MILQELLRLQDRHGYLPRIDLERLAERLAVPQSRIHEVASFYPHFRLFRDDENEEAEALRLPEWEITVCRDMACRLRGSCEYLRRLRELATSSGKRVDVREVNCIGRCDRAPAVRIIKRERFAAVTHPQNGHGHEIRALMGRPIEKVCEAVSKTLLGDIAELPNDRDMEHVLPQPADGWHINCYAGKPREDRYKAIRMYLDKLTEPGHAAAVDELTRQYLPIEKGIKFKEGSIRETKDATERAHLQQELETLQKNTLARAKKDKCHLHAISLALWTANLHGMGGPGARAYKKWSEVVEAQGAQKFVVCNGDESEPGTFKDRELLLRTPYLVVEGVILAGLFIGAKKGYIYIRHEYEECIEAVRDEIQWARQQGYCGEAILGTDLSFDVEVFVSPGGYICGEQTALIQVLQDERSEPRVRPPELQTNGLWNMPTLLNNVETLAWVPAIVTQEDCDGQWYSNQGESPKHKGARLFSVSGDVNRPGVYEVPIGITLGKLIDDYCGGMTDGRTLKAVALSGPSGGFLPAKLPLASFHSAAARKQLEALAGPGGTEFDIRELPLDIGVTRDLFMLGAAIVVYSDGADLVDQAVACLKFYQSESCGKCVPCRIGSTKLAELGERLQSKKLTPESLESLSNKNGGLITSLARTMADTAICGLGQVAPNALQTLLAHFPDDVKPYLR